MREPEEVLATGTRVRTNDVLVDRPTFMVTPMHVAHRRRGEEGVVQGFVAGHGGDVYWVRHASGEVAAYDWSEFELVDPPRHEEYAIWRTCDCGWKPPSAPSKEAETRVVSSLRGSSLRLRCPACKALLELAS